MSFLGRKKQDDKKQAVPAPESAPKAAKKEASGGIRQWLIDSYNGLYKVVLEPNMPTKQTVILLVLGVIIGVSWGYITIQFTGANPDRLNQSAQDQWILMVAGNYERGFYGTEAAAELLTRVNTPATAIQRMLETSSSASDAAALQNLFPIAQQVQGTPPPTAPLGGLLDWLIIILVVTIVTPIVVLLWRMLIYENLVVPVIEKFKEARNSEYRAERDAQRQAIAVMKQQRAAQEAMRGESAKDELLGEPVMQSLSIFNRSRSYDDSMEIELPLAQGGDFLGQCGAVLAESVDPDPVAIELWIFDMRSQQNLKKVFITPAGNADPAVMSRLQSDPDISANDIVVANVGSTATIDTDNLRLQGKISTLSLGDDGRFNEFQMQIRAWQKKGSNVGASTPAPAPMPVATPPTSAPPMSTYDNLQFDPPPVPPATNQRPLSAYDDIEFDPPPAPPSSQQSPSVGSLMGNSPAQPQRLQPPPMRYTPANDDDDDEDPFGGTGDFTPLGR